MSQDDIKVVIKQYDTKIRLTGSMGPTGLQGPIGPQGPRGLPGTIGTSSATDITIDSGTDGVSGDIVFLTNSIERASFGFDGVFRVGDGDNQNVYISSSLSKGGLQSLSKGRAGAPDKSLLPVLKVSRLIQLPQDTASYLYTHQGGNNYTPSDIPLGDGNEQLSAIMAVAVGTALNEVQPIGVLGGAVNFGQHSLTNIPARPDAVGVFGKGYIPAGGVGAAFGGCFVGRKTSTNPDARARGMELDVQNYSGIDGAFQQNNILGTDIIGMHISPQGNADASVAIMIHGNDDFAGTGSVRFAYGISFASDSHHGIIGGVKNASIRDDSHSSFGIQINGAHAQAAIAVNDAAGPVLIGRTDQVYTGSLLEVSISGGATVSRPIVAIYGQNEDVGIRIKNSSGSHNIFVAAGADRYMTGTHAGDFGIQVITIGTEFHIGGTASVLRVNQGNGLFVTVPAVEMGNPTQVWDNGGFLSRSYAPPADGLAVNGFSSGQLIPYSPNYFSNLAQVDNRVFLVRFIATKTVVKHIAFHVITASDSAADAIEIAIFNSDLSQILGTSGSVAGKLGPSAAVPNASVQTVAIGGVNGITLRRGDVYYAAFGFKPNNGQVGAVIAGSNFAAHSIMGSAPPNLITGYKDVAYPLTPIVPPTSLGKTNLAPILGLLTT